VYRPKSAYRSRLANEAVTKRRQRGRHESPRERRMWDHWMSELDRLCPCRGRGKATCLTFVYRRGDPLKRRGGYVYRVTGLRALYPRDLRNVDEEALG
jgi:hypothetical protein